MKLLLVDDDPDIVLIASMALGSSGFEVVAASTAAGALEAAARARPDAILLDCVLPDGDGPDVLSKLRADPRLAEVPVIFCTGRSDPGETARLLALGGRGVIAKPFDPTKFGAEVRRLLGLKSQIPNSKSK